jgi:hypothetical protein
MDARIVDMKDGRKERAACQEAMKANREKMEPNPAEKEAEVKRQENPNEEAAICSLGACRNERTPCQVATETNLEKIEPSDSAIAILEKIEPTDLKKYPEEME